MGKGTSKAGGGSAGGSAGGGGIQQNDDTFTKGSTTYSIENDGKNYYLIMQTGNLKTRDRISYADNDDKARVNVKGFGAIQLNEEPGLIKLLNNARNNNASQIVNSLPSKIANLSKQDINSFYNAPKGTTFSVYTRYNQYIGEYTKGDGKKWVATQKGTSPYPRMKSVSTPKAMENEIGMLTVKFKKKKGGK